MYEHWPIDKRTRRDIFLFMIRNHVMYSKFPTRSKYFLKFSYFYKRVWFVTCLKIIYNVSNSNLIVATKLSCSVINSGCASNTSMKYYSNTNRIISVSNHFPRSFNLKQFMLYLIFVYSNAVQSRTTNKIVNAKQDHQQICINTRCSIVFNLWKYRWWIQEIYCWSR